MSLCVTELKSNVAAHLHAREVRILRLQRRAGRGGDAGRLAGARVSARVEGGTRGRPRPEEAPTGRLTGAASEPIAFSRGGAPTGLGQNSAESEPPGGALSPTSGAQRTRQVML